MYCAMCTVRDVCLHWLRSCALGFKSDISAKAFACTLLVHPYILDCSIQAVLARMLMNQLWPTERLESLRTRAGRIAASRLSWPGC